MSESSPNSRSKPRGTPNIVIVATLLICPVASSAAAEPWRQPVTTTSVETGVCNRENDGDAHGRVCLKLDCAGRNQYRFTIIADEEFFRNTTFSSGPHSITLKMEEYRSADVILKDWNVSRAIVGIDFLNRIAAGRELTVQCEGCKSIAITLANFSAELRRVAAACKHAKQP